MTRPFSRELIALKISTSRTTCVVLPKAVSACFPRYGRMFSTYPVFASAIVNSLMPNLTGFILMYCLMDNRPLNLSIVSSIYNSRRGLCVAENRLFRYASTLPIFHSLLPLSTVASSLSTKWRNRKMWRKRRLDIVTYSPSFVMFFDFSLVFCTLILLMRTFQSSADISGNRQFSISWAGSVSHTPQQAPGWRRCLTRLSRME